MSQPSSRSYAVLSRPRRLAFLLAAALTCLLAVGFGAAGAASAVPAPVDLATAATYSVLGGQTVTNTGPSRLSGDLGVSPGTAITGFPPGRISGARHAADATSLKAQSDLTTAYDDASGRAKTGAVAGDLVGQTKVAGVYKSTGPLALSGTLTLDGQGDPNSVFIFQIASTLKTATASYINMINGAQACNVFWQVGSSATLGTASVFRGTIMALTSISVTTDAVVQGRALARNGAVTLDDDTFTSAACGTTTPTTTTRTTVATSPTATTTGSTATLTATVTGGSGLTGTVVFSSGGTVLGTAPIDSTGHATLKIPTGSKAGTRHITAHYSGSLTAAPSTSAPVALRVRIVPTAKVAARAAAGPTATASPTPSGTVLAATGTRHLATFTVTAAGLLTLGLLATWAGRRRRHALHRR